MDRKTAENYYANYDWFKRFFNGLNDLLRRDVAAALKPVGYDDNWPGFPKEKYRPTMPSYFQVVYYGQAKGLPGLQIVALLDGEWENECIPTGEPHLMIFVHDEEGNDTGIAPEILRELSEKPDAGMRFRGKLKRPLNFYGFLVPLDAFSEEQLKAAKVETVIQERVIKPLEAILKEHFSKPGKKART